MRYLLGLIVLVMLVSCGGGGSSASPMEPEGDRHTISLWHCGIDPTSFDGDRWYVPDPPFDETNKGASLEGTMTRVSAEKAVFEAESGERVEFMPLVGEWEKPLCD